MWSNQKRLSTFCSDPPIAAAHDSNSADIHVTLLFCNEFVLFVVALFPESTRLTIILLSFVLRSCLILHFGECEEKDKRLRCRRLRFEIRDGTKDTSECLTYQ